MSVLLYAIYGKDDRFQLELDFSIASALRYMKDDPADVRIVLMSDRPGAGAVMGVEQVLLTADQIHDWQMKGTFNHAFKLGAFKHAMELYRDKVILIDSDTFFCCHPKQLFDRVSPGNSLLHVDEGPLSAQAGQAWARALNFSTRRLAGYELSPQSHMFNTGVVGIDPADAGLIDRSIALMVELRMLDKIFTAEQLATSVVLAQETTTTFCPQEIDHYTYRARSYFHYQFKRAYPTPDAAAFRRMVDTPFQVTEHPPIGLKSKILARLNMLRRRNGPVYESAYRHYLEALEVRGDPELANVYADLALNILTYGYKDWSDHTEADFARFSASTIGSEDWLSPGNATRWKSYWARQKAASTGALPA